MTAAARGRLYVGRRGRVLIFFGCLDLIYAVSLAAPGEEARRTSFFLWLTAVLPLWVWSLLWGGVGVNCIVHGVRRRDRWGYAAAIFLKVLWGLVCLGGWLFGSVERGYVSAAVWLGLAYLVGVLSGWAEPGDGRGPTWIRPLR